MPGIIPDLSSQERDLRLKILRKNAVYSISTQWALDLNTTNLNVSDGSGLGVYTANVINLPYSYSIIGVRLRSALLADNPINPYFALALSYSAMFSIGPSMGIATQPDEAGNIIYSAAQTEPVLNETVWFKNGPTEDNFFVPANTPMYVYLWATDALAAADEATAQGLLTLYVEHTGIRT